MKKLSKILILTLFLTLGINTGNNMAKAQEEREAANENETVMEEKTDEKAGQDLDNILVMELKDGKVIAELRPDLAPNHVARIKELTREGFYDGIVFHRVIDGFMAQTGDPTGTGRGGSGQNLDAEFSSEKHVRGTLSMARAADPNSADSQFFIMFGESPHLDNNYTVFGQVVEGMDNVDKIKKGFGPNGMVSDPDKIISMKVAADLEYTDLPESLKVTPKAEKNAEVKDVQTETEVKTNEDGSIDVIKKTLVKGELKSDDIAAGVKEMKKKAENIDADKPASMQ